MKLNTNYRTLNLHAKAWTPTRRIMAYMLALGSAAYFVSAAFATTTIQVTTNVLVRNVPRLGINMSDNYYAQPNLKVRGSLNFEGLRCRQIHPGILYSNGFTSFKIRLNWQDPWFSNVYLGAKFRLLSAPANGEEGMIAEIQERAADIWNNGDVTMQAFFVFDQPLTGYNIPAEGLRSPAFEQGLLIDGTNMLNKGYMGQTNYYWNKNGCEIVLNDTHPDTFGNAACKLKPGAEIRCMGISPDGADIFGSIFKVSFYIKRFDGSPTIEFDISKNNNNIPVTAPNNWEYKEFIITNNTYDSLNLVFKNISSGSAMIDDVLFEQIDQNNPSSYRDDMVDLYKNELNIGVMRYVQMGGWSIEDQIRPINQTRNYKSSIGSKPEVYEEYGYNSKQTISIPDICSASEEIGCIPWICISGTIYPDEMNTLIEFLAGPTNTPWGDFRANVYNHPLPYTETLDEILIEFGNEAWNLVGFYNAKGYNGPNYWRDCISVAKSNPYYNPKIKIMTAGQNFSTSQSDRILNDATNSDFYAIAPYVLHNVENEQFEVFDPTLEFDSEETLQKLFKWNLAYPIHYAEDKMPAQYTVSTNTGVEFSLYEYNYHNTGGAGEHWLRRLFNFSIAHGISMANYSLINLKVYNIRNQCAFTTLGLNAFGAGLWGHMLSLKPSELQHRPVAYADALANKVRRGNLMETVHSGDVPEFQIYGEFSGDYKTNQYDEIYSYAFQDNGTNGLILFNYGLDSTQNIQILLKEYVKDELAECWELSSRHYTNANEWASKDPSYPPEKVPHEFIVPEIVVPTNYNISNFKSGFSFDMMPCSQYVFKWVRLAAFPNLVVLPTEITVPENGTNTFIVKLSDNPVAGPVTVTVAWLSGDTDLSVQSGSPAVLTTNNWETGVAITLAAGDDPDMDNDSAVFRCSAEGMKPVDVTATEAENDLGIVVSETTVFIPEGSTADFGVKLSMNPGGNQDVDVARTSGDADITVQGAPLALNFDSGNWDDFQTVTLDAAEDGDIENGTALITCSDGSGGAMPDVTVTAVEIDNDTVGLVVNPLFLTIEEGNTATCMIHLAAIPPENSTVQVVKVSGPENITVSDGEFIVFGAANYNIDQTVVFSSAEDDDKICGAANFRFQPLFPNTDGSIDVKIVETVDNDAENISFRFGENGYTNTIDSWISGYNNNKDYNYGADIKAYFDKHNRYPLIKWGLDGIPNTALVVSAAIELTIKRTSAKYSNSFEVGVYPLKKKWVEGTGDSSGLPADGVTYNTTDGATPWETPGASGTTDRGDLAGSVFISEVYDDNYRKILFSLNSVGIEALQSYIVNSNQNYGFIFENTVNIGRRYSYPKETSVEDYRPKLYVNYVLEPATPPQNPSININNGELQTTSNVVSLELYADTPTPTSMKVSEASNFFDTGWVNYTTTYEFTLSENYEVKTVYAQFSDGGAGISEIVNDSIAYVPEPFLFINCYLLFIICYLRRKLIFYPSNP